MTFLYNKTNPNFATSQVHGVLRLETQNGHLVAVVNSYAVPEAYEADKLNWQDSYQIPVTAAADPQSWLIGPEGPFAGGTLLDEVTPLAKLQSIKWAQIKAERDRLTTGGFAYMGNVFQSDARSSLMIANAGIRAINDPDYTDTWTAANDTLVPMTNEELKRLACALVEHGSAIHHTGTTLREQIYAEDVTEEILNTIHWPI